MEAPAKHARAYAIAHSYLVTSNPHLDYDTEEAMRLMAEALLDVGEMVADLTLGSSRWRVVTLPRRPEDPPMELYITSPTTDPEMISQIEQACARSGMAMYRV